MEATDFGRHENRNRSSAILISIAENTGFPRGRFPTRVSIKYERMSATLIDGAALAEREKQSIQQRVARLAESARRPALTAVLVGSTPAGELYANRQAQACEN